VKNLGKGFLTGKPMGNGFGSKGGIKAKTTRTEGLGRLKKRKGETSKFTITTSGRKGGTPKGKKHLMGKRAGGRQNGLFWTAGGKNGRGNTRQKQLHITMERLGEVSWRDEGKRKHRFHGGIRVQRGESGKTPYEYGDKAGN